MPRPVRAPNPAGIRHVLNMARDLVRDGTPVDWADLLMNAITIQHMLSLVEQS